MISLAPLSHQDAVEVDRADNHPDTAGAFSWFGYSTPQMAARVADGTALRENDGVLGVRDGEDTLVGHVSWSLRDNAPPPQGRCWMIGILILPEHRGQGYGARAQRAIAEYLFAHTPFARIEASTEVDNVAERRALESAGFAQEGVLRHANFRDGHRRDMVLYSILREELWP